MITQAFIAVESLVILVLLAALIVGQPASAQADRAQLTANATVISALRGNGPTPTPFTRFCPGSVRC